MKQLETSDEHQILYKEINAIADNELARLVNMVPDDPINNFIILLEITRIYDYLNFGKGEEIKKYGFTFQEIDVLKSGWNLATSFLFKSLKTISGIPIIPSSEEFRKLSISLLYQFGCITLLRRTAEMIRSGILIADYKKENIFKFSMSPDGKAQFLDEMEHSYLKNLEDRLEQNKNSFYNGWELVDYDNVNSVFQNYGSFLSKRHNDPFSSLKLEDLESKMTPLLKSWDSGKGIMMGYDSTEELDWHFMAISTNALAQWRDEAGLHPDLKIEGVKVSHIIAVVMCLVSFNLKHIKFASIAEQQRKEILIFQSLTIWCSLTELINDISDFTNIEKRIVAQVFEIISFKASDAALIKNHTTKFMPLIINLENDFVLRPVSSIVRNPLNTLKDLLLLRNPQLTAEFNKGRESWLRNYLYAMFTGTRYHRIEGNIALRINKKFITDIDAVIYDNVTGELALFQIKWQDYHLNDVKKLRSKASNLTKELEEWTKKVYEWISSQGVDRLAHNLRVPKNKKISESKIYLFGLSKDAARMKGYGFELKEERIAIGTWAQFQRNRTEIGPSNSVFGDLFNTLKEQENEVVEAIPKPVTFKVSDKEFYYKDLWNVIEIDKN
ncbi:hypothetical protein [Chryseobacterium lacus]|uniref:hypothetical protein n=1 Tax=Chryseobacterium lacus TaxID=2058346 RepID=UPI000F88876D|nr:hypothetical protein [Chryseobacterium lacus]RST26238.1 hypothetical protein EIZ46_06860 [Chryseobacterium lacus]